MRSIPLLVFFAAELVYLIVCALVLESMYQLCVTINNN